MAHLKKHSVIIPFTAVAVATLLRLAIDPWVRTDPPYAFFVLAVVVTAQLAGFFPAIGATILSVLSCKWFFIAPRYSFVLESDSAYGLALFILTCFLISRLIPALSEAATRKRASAELRRSEERFRTLAAATFEGICISQDDRIVDMNEQLTRLFGYERKELVGQPLSRLFTASSGEQALRDIHEERQSAAEHEALLKDGSVRIVELRGKDIESSKGSFLITAVRDITERKRSDEELRESQQFLRKVFDNAYDGILIHTLTGRIVDVNARYLELHGIKSREEALESTMWKTSAASTQLERIPGLWADTLAGHPQFFEWRGRRLDDGTEYDEEVYLGALHLHGQDLILANIRDITERKQREEKLREADRRKDEFLAMLAHELRNPMSTIAAAASLLSRGNLTGPLERACDALSRQTRQLAKLVDDLLDISRITSGKVNLERDYVDLREPLKNALEASRADIEGKEDTLELSIDHDVLPVYGDPFRLQQIINNLLSNAARHMDKRGVISVRAFRDGDMATVEVRDSGEGIEPDAQRKIFEPFTQINPGLQRKKGGLGIGLAVVKQLTELHGGKVGVYSEGLGKGSTFTVSFPVTNTLPVRGGKGDIAVEAGLLMLIVDDNRDSAELTADILQEEGHHTLIAFDGEAALEIARKAVPDVVLLDIGLPGMNGYEVARDMRSSDLKAPLCIAVTGYGEARDRQLSAEAGFDHHLLKPVDCNEILRLVAEWQRTERREEVHCLREKRNS